LTKSRHRRLTKNPSQRTTNRIALLQVNHLKIAAPWIFVQVRPPTSLALRPVLAMNSILALADGVAASRMSRYSSGSMIRTFGGFSGSILTCTDGFLKFIRSEQNRQKDLIAVSCAFFTRGQAAAWCEHVFNTGLNDSYAKRYFNWIRQTET